MTIDGVLVGAFVLAVGVLLGQWLAVRGQDRIDAIEDELGGIITRQAHENVALRAYIADHSDVSAEDLGL